MWRKIVSKKANTPLVDINDPEVLQQWYTSYYPMGSGPLGVMSAVCSLLEAIADEKGITLELPTGARQ